MNPEISFKIQEIEKLQLVMNELILSIKDIQRNQRVLKMEIELIEMTDMETEELLNLL